MIPLPSFLATPIRMIVGIISLVAIGAGVYFGWRWTTDRDNKAALEAKPAIAANTQAIDTATQTQVRSAAQYHSASSSFLTAATRARTSPSTSPEVKACFDAGVAVISKCDSARTADSTLIELYKKRAKLMEDEAIRAQRGRLLGVSLAAGYEPFYGAPAVRGEVDLNFSNNWSAIATADIAAKARAQTQRSGFIGLSYHFGGRR